MYICIYIYIYILLTRMSNFFRMGDNSENIGHLMCDLSVMAFKLIQQGL